jgi:hypothetical protein
MNNIDILGFSISRFYKRFVLPNKVLHLTAIPLRSFAAGEPQR